jgi:hypothetical protein
MTADIWASKLEAFGIRAIVQPSHNVYFTGDAAGSCRLQVDEADLEAARELLAGEDEAPAERGP